MAIPAVLIERFFMRMVNHFQKSLPGQVPDDAPALEPRAYKGYIDRGRAIIADIVKERRLKEKTVPGWTCPEGIDTDVLETAFVGSPNKHSALALELYLTQKCIVEGLGKSTGEGIHGAWAKYWDELPGGKYAGAYSYNEETGKVTGCPARAVEIQAFVKCIKTKARVKCEAATRRHAEATTIEDMKKMIDWSESKCSAEALKECKPKDLDALLLLLKHGMIRAFLSSGYSLWTRNFKLCQLQERDLTPGCKGPAPYYLPYIEQKQGYDGPLKSNHYDIYEQKDTPEICMFTHVMAWRKVYRQRLDREFEPDDYIFPYIAPNGVIHPKKPMSHDLVQDYINEFAAGASINKIFTTHCLRRGGSQYRFMFAAIGKRWSLSIIRWWGGWAEGEQVDTLMRYLLDSLQSYESGHGDALNPHRLEPDKSFMGDHDALKAPTVAEFRTLSEQILTKLDHFSTHVHTSCHSNTSSHAPTPAMASLSIQTVFGANTSNSTTIATAPTSLIPSATSSHMSHAEPIFEDARVPGTSIPLAGVSIPGVGKDSKSWRRAIDQWENGDPSTGLIPLKDWPAEYYTGKMRLVTGALYSNRKLLATESKRFMITSLLFTTLFLCKIIRSTPR
ncbi:hypothetical protein B0H17DRAFT_1164583 [Mycena rosella]|uniref:Uncharacterized protein n=1 Tax=Mycena rosella TaxID=1033263 RepID=A0AAD7BH20_MYCRO|nr:hypothetical protein B0H17DRAFT_1164583 [Mycena rosella]